MILDISVAAQSITARPVTDLAEGTLDAICARLAFSPEWDGLEKFAVFKLGELDPHVARVINDVIPKIEGHLNFAAGVWTVSVFGEKWIDGELIERITTGIARFSVAESIVDPAEPFPGITASVGEQIIAEALTAAHAAEQAAEDAKNAAAGVDDAAARAETSAVRAAQSAEDAASAVSSSDDAARAAAGYAGLAETAKANAAASAALAGDERKAAGNAAAAAEEAASAASSAHASAETSARTAADDAAAASSARSDIISGYGSWRFSALAAARTFDINLPASAGDKFLFRPLVWGGATPPTSISLLGNNGGAFTTLGGVTAVGLEKTIEVKANYGKLRVAFNNAPLPTAPVEMSVLLVKMDSSLTASVIEQAADIETAQRSISALETSTEAIREELSTVAARVDGLHAPDIDCFCSTVYAVVGHEINVYYHNIFLCDNLDNYRITFLVDGGAITGTSIIAMEDGIRITPTAAQIGSHTVRLRVEQNGVLLKTYDFPLVISADSPPTLKAIFIGDSMTQQATYIAEAQSMTPGMTLYGTRETATRTYADPAYDKVIKHEGRGGWTTGNYCNNASVGSVTNPFYSGGFDFAHYIASHPEFSDVTDVFVLLGTNDTRVAVETVTGNLQTMIDSIHAYRGGIRVHVGLPIPPCKDKFAAGSTTTWDHKRAMYNLCRNYVSALRDCFFVPYNSAIDCWHGWARTSVQVAAKLTDRAERPTDYFHPAQGRYQMGDAVYAELIANCV